MSTVKEICRFICGLIDSVIYEIISKMYDLFYEIADLILYSQEMFDAIGKRIVLILGIFMLFRLAISLVSYLISPDKLKDNSKGGAKMVINIIVSVVLLSTVNIIFVQAYKVQKKVVDSKIVEKIFFGERAEIPNLDIAYILYSGFITPNVNILPGCENLFNTYIPIEQKCQESFSSANISGDAKKVIKEDVLQKHDLNEVFKEYSLLNAKYNGEYLFEYMPIVSTVAGIIIAFVLISFSMDLALRSVKMIFLQIIAPIPIIANMDPGKGSEIFKKWYKETITTYVSLFIRIIAISFAVFLITLITVNFSDVFKGRSTLLTVLLIIGCLMFAKQVPKLIEDMLGIKMEGMALNPLKKFQEQALFGKNITGLAAGATVGTIGMLSGAGLGRGIAGGFVGLVGGKGFGETWKSQALSNKNMRTARAEGTTFFGRRIEQLTSGLGLPSPTDIDARNIKNYDDQLEEQDRLMEDVTRRLEPLKSEMSVLDTLQSLKSEMEKRAESKILEGKSEYSGDVIKAQSKIDTLKSSAANLRDYVMSQGGNEADYRNELNKLNAEIATATAEYNSKLKDSRQKYIQDALQGKLKDENGIIKTDQDAVLQGKISDYNEKIEANRSYGSIENLNTLTNSSTFNELDDQDITITQSNQTIKHSTYGLEREKSTIEEEQRRIRQEKRDYQNSDSYRRHQANKNALGGK